MKEKEAYSMTGKPAGSSSADAALEVAATANAPGGIVIDPTAGISEEEQREILGEINRITLKTRLVPEGESREVGTPGKKRAGSPEKFTARKKDGLFPALVNAAAAVLLAGGFFVLSSSQGKEEVTIREGNRMYNIAETALIEEIRRETSSQLEIKEREIALMMSKLAGIDTELQELQDSAETLSSAKEAELRNEIREAVAAERRRLTEQRLSEADITDRMRQFDAERTAGMNTELTSYRRQLDAERAGSEAALRILQEEYRSNLAVLQKERAQLLESSRARESALRTQLDAKTRELAAMSDQAQADLDGARSEVERLSQEREKAAVIESQLGGYYALVRDQMQNGLSDDAAGTLQVMREYLNTPAFQGIRSIQARKDIYAASIDLLETVIHDRPVRESTDPEPSGDGETDQIIAGLTQRNAELEESLAALTAAASVNTEAVRSSATLQTQIAELERRLRAASDGETTLKNRNAALEQQAAERERTLTALQNQNTALTQTVADRDAAIGDLRTRTASQEDQIQSLNTQLNTIRAALQALSQ
ncbi:MAG: hypothetical protein LBH70_02725 [Spirochaetaceae bacterium]|nr:hypothetical protein [Spirochaetaceae bacterium]